MLTPEDDFQEHLPYFVRNKWGSLTNTRRSSVVLTHSHTHTHTQSINQKLQTSIFNCYIMFMMYSSAVLKFYQNLKLHSLVTVTYTPWLPWRSWDCHKIVMSHSIRKNCFIKCDSYRILLSEGVTTALIPGFSLCSVHVLFSRFHIW